jgi:hypothetical protein
MASVFVSTEVAPCLLMDSKQKVEIEWIKKNVDKRRSGDALFVAGRDCGTETCRRP